ncbi:MBL fold metallo-hydrolase [Pseudomonas sp. KCJK8927]|uniref:MBL fold metallo-hydrolase n=1 Tax=Pseudomonas sp. KCJK8927 TaxID=3344560 RepID=UPI003905F4B4
MKDNISPVSAQSIAIDIDYSNSIAWPKTKFRTPYICNTALSVTLIKSGTHTVLVDASFGNIFSQSSYAETLNKQLAASGIVLESITDIVLTHLHVEQIGGLLIDGVRSRLSADVNVHLSMTEFDFWANRDFSRFEHPLASPDLLGCAALDFLKAYASRISPFRRHREVAPGVIASLVGGHTPGHCIVYVNSDGKRLTFTGDALVPAALDHPSSYNGFDHEPEESVLVRMALLHEAASSGELVVATRLPFPSVGRVAVDGKGFRWVAGI